MEVTMTRQDPYKSKPERLGRMSMEGVELTDALRAAMQIPVPPPAPRKRKKVAKKTSKKK